MVKKGKFSLSALGVGKLACVGIAIGMVVFLPREISCLVVPFPVVLLMALDGML